jgi:hypothetical protein
VGQHRIPAHADRIPVDVSALPPGIFVAQVLSSSGVHQAMARLVKE